MITCFAMVLALESPPVPVSRSYDGPDEVVAVAVDPIPPPRAQPRPIIATARVDASPAKHRTRTPRPALFIAGGAFLYAVSTTLRFIQHVSFRRHVCDDNAICTDVNPPLVFAVELGTLLLVDPASVGLVAVGAEALGERDATAMTSGRKRPRGQLGFLAGGGTIATVGVLGIVATFVVFATTSPSDAENFAREGGRQFALALVVVGAGLVAYGSSLPEQRVRRRPQLRPQVSRRYLGLSLAWRY